MGKTHKRRIKVSEIVVSENATIGNVKFNGKKPEPHERRTIDFLSILGYDVETIIPSNVPGSRNPDILMMGTFWEMKGPISANKQKIIKRFRKAIKQSAGKSVFDLRNIKRNSDRDLAEKIILQLFAESGDMKRIIIIKNDKIALDIMK